MGCGGGIGSMVTGPGGESGTPKPIMARRISGVPNFQPALHGSGQDSIAFSYSFDFRAALLPDWTVRSSAASLRISFRYPSCSRSTAMSAAPSSRGSASRSGRVSTARSALRLVTASPTSRSVKIRRSKTKVSCESASCHRIRKPGTDRALSLGRAASKVKSWPASV